MSNSYSVAQFLETHTTLRAPELCPELRLHLGEELDVVWKSLEETSLARGLPPYWAVAWPAGQALARYLLDHPQVCAGRSVVDVGSGSGICAIAASLAGAESITACDWDPLACAVIAQNALANHVEVATRCSATEALSERWDVILAADIWYERFASRTTTAWLRKRAADGAAVLLCDTGRAFFPRDGVRQVQRISVATSSIAVTAGVWSLAGCA